MPGAEPLKPVSTTQSSPDGFFTLARRGGRWVLLTPDRRPFFSAGLNHIDSSLLRYPEHLDHWNVLKAIGKHCDVLLIQYYSFYTDLHNTTLRDLHRKTGLPIINGDHAYSHKTHRHTKLKGLEVHSEEAVAEHYASYTKQTMIDHPYALGWWYCGFYDSFGRPNLDIPARREGGQRNAVRWHATSMAEAEAGADVVMANPPLSGGEGGIRRALV